MTAMFVGAEQVTHTLGSKAFSEGSTPIFEGSSTFGEASSTLFYSSGCGFRVSEVFQTDSTLMRFIVVVRVNELFERLARL